MNPQNHPAEQLSRRAARAATKARVLVVDDHPIVREGLANVINRTNDLAICGQAENPQVALEIIETSKPDIVIADISLAGQSGLDLVKDISVRYPQIPIVVHSMHDESLYAERCLRSGARGYVMKQEPPQRLLEAVRGVLRGEVCLSKTMTERLLHRFSDSRRLSPMDSLTEREFQVLDLIGHGHPTRRVAELLHVSDKTVQTHREHLKEKLSLKDATSLVKYAVQWVQGQE